MAKNIGLHNNKKVVIMFEDEAGFGRISDPAACWAPPKKRPCAPSQRIREYRTIYGAVCPITGESFFEMHTGSNSDYFQAFIVRLSEKFPDYYIVFCCDNASWHSSGKISVPKNMELCFIPPRTPEMNPIEQIWKEIRKRGFKNIVFDTIGDVVSKLWKVVNSISKETIVSITLRKWIVDVLSRD